MYLNNLQQDSVFVSSEMKPLQSFTGMTSRRGLENVIISNGKIVNVVSNSYGHIPNELFFKHAESMLIDADLKYQKRSINRSDRSFIIDFIIEDENQFSVKHAEDIILPMLRFKNSYDGSERTSGHFGFYRKVCSNGLHVAEAMKINDTTFKVAAPFSSYAIQDGNLITGQQQNSGAAAAEMVVNLLTE